MMRQYLTVKAQYPKAVVLFRMGDFFETFYDDAETCSRLLDLTLTKRNNERDAPPMAGVPHHAIGGYIARLVDLRKTVVLVDQVEDPKKAKGLVRREVTRVLTPGTFVDPEAAARTPAYLVAVTIPRVGSARRKSAVWGLAALDLATGELRATAAAGEQALVDEVGRLAAKEVVIDESAAADPMITGLCRAMPKVALSTVETADGEPKETLDRLAASITAEEVGALERVLPAYALHAAGLALRYAEQTQLRDESFERKAGGSLGHVDTLQPYLPGDALILDAEARAHLELFESAGDRTRHGALIGVIDEAVTSMGARLMARWLARPRLDPLEIGARHDAVAAFVVSPSALDGVRTALDGVHDLERLVGKVVMGRSNPRDVASLRASLDRVPQLVAFAASTTAGQVQLDAIEAGDRQGRLAAIAAVDPCADVAAAIAAALVERPPTDLGGERVFVEGYDAALDELFAMSRHSKQVVAEIEQRERSRTGITSLKVKYNKVFGYFIEVTKANLAMVPDDYVRKQTTVNAERYFTSELKALEEKILSADGERLARESTLFAALVREVAGHVRRLKLVADAISELDALAALAHVAERNGWSRPDIDTGELIEITDGRHPVLEALAGELGERFVPNDMTIGDPERLLIITGPNMAGKSTIMRQTALITILAQMGSFVPARAARIGVVDRIFTRVGASDDLSRGRSTFMVEMTETARILRSATRRSLLLLDEIGRGTSTFDGLSIAWAVAEHIHDRIGARTLFATHYHELTEICRDKAQAANLHVAVKEWNEDIVFLRKLLPGPTNRSYGVQVARLAGLPKVVISRARAVLDTLEAHDLSTTRGPTAQLGLFAPPPKGPTSDVLDALRALSVEDTTPRQALDCIAEWQARLRELDAL